MRLDHLLSKEISKGCCLLFSHQGLSAAQNCEDGEANLFAETSETGTRRAKDKMKIIGSVKRPNNISGGDALRGHTRSHPEHDG